VAPRTAWTRGRLPHFSLLAALALGLCAPLVWPQSDTGVRPFEVVGDAIAQPLTGVAGDATRGRRIVASRQLGLCLLCHSGPFPEERLQGTLAPDLAGAGSRWSEGRLRLRLVDGRRLSPESIMPSYHRVDGLTRVGTPWKSQPVLSAQQIEDVIAFLRTLRD